MKVINVCVAGLLVILGLTGCTAQEAEPLEPERVNLSYEELSSIEGYNELLSESCDGSLNNTLSNLTFLPLGDNVSGPAPSEVMKTRTQRILEAIGDESSESSMLDESLDWNPSEYGVETTYWTFPTASVREVVVSSIDENLIAPLFRGETPVNPEVKERVLAEWLEVCGVAKAFSDATTTTSTFEAALEDLQESFEGRYISQGFTKYPDGLVKMEIVESQINFSFVKTDFCSLVASVTFAGNPDADGLTPSDETVEFRLNHSLEFAQIKSSFDIQKESNRTLEFHDLQNGRLTGVSCFF